MSEIKKNFEPKGIQQTIYYDVIMTIAQDIIKLNQRLSWKERPTIKQIFCQPKEFGSFG